MQRALQVIIDQRRFLRLQAVPIHYPGRPLHHPRSWHLSYFRLHRLLLKAKYLIKSQGFSSRYPISLSTLS